MEMHVSNGEHRGKRWKHSRPVRIAATVGGLVLTLAVSGGVGQAGASTLAVPLTTNPNALTQDLENPLALQQLGTTLTSKMPGTYTFTQTNPTVTMSDGVGLAATVYTPSGTPPSGGWPAVVMMHGWGGNRSEFNGIAPLFASHGFVVLTFDARGFGQSGGQTGLAGSRDILDVYQMMMWLIQDQGVSPNRIGLTGISYGAGRSILAAADDSSSSFNDPTLFGTLRGGLPPKVAAIAPIAGWTNLEYALYPNRVMKMSFDTGLYAVGANPASNNYPPTLTEWMAEGITGLNTQDFANGLEARSVTSTPAWQSLAETPMYAFQAWKDELFPAEQVVPLFEGAAENPSSSLYNSTAAGADRLYLGSFGHAGATFGANEGEYIFEQVLYFMEQQLQHETTPLSTQPRVGVSPETWNGSSSVDYYSRYPVPGALTDTKYLSGTQLASTPPTSDLPNVLVNNPTDGSFADPNLVPPLPLDSLTQTAGSTVGSPSAVQFSMPLSQNYHLQGEPEVTLYLQSATPTDEVTARLYDYSPTSGTWTFVTRGATEAGNLSLTDATKVGFNLYSANHVFPAGDKLVLEISPSDAPFFKPDATAFSLILQHTGADPSNIVLPHVPN
jgi:ABC-2 type transport system ATP-binding protein